MISHGDIGTAKEAQITSPCHQLLVEQRLRYVELEDVSHQKKTKTFLHLERNTAGCGVLYIPFPRSLNHLERRDLEQQTDDFINGRKVPLGLLNNHLWLRFRFIELSRKSCEMTSGMAFLNSEA